LYHMTEIMNSINNKAPLIWDYTVFSSILQLSLALILMLFLALIYKKLNSDVEDSHIMMHAMVYIGVIMTGTIMLISSNPVVAIGLFGAISIVRFRTALRSPIDTSFIFLCVVVGISCGLGMFLHATILTFFTGGLMVVLNRISFGKTETSGIRCNFTISISKQFFQPEMIEQMNALFKDKTRLLEIKTKKKRIKLKYSRQLSSLNDTKEIRKILEPIYKQDPSMKLAIEKK